MGRAGALAPERGPFDVIAHKRLFPFPTLLPIPPLSVGFADTSPSVGRGFLLCRFRPLYSEHKKTENDYISKTPHYGEVLLLLFDMTDIINS